MFDAEVAWVMRSDAARGELADLARATKGASALRARDWSIAAASIGGCWRRVAICVGFIRGSG